MKSHRFAVRGSMRTFWEFYFGYGIAVSLSLLVQAVLFWQLATLAKTQGDDDFENGWRDEEIARRVHSQHQITKRERRNDGPDLTLRKEP